MQRRHLAQAAIAASLLASSVCLAASPVIKLGTMSGPHGEIAQKAAEVAKRMGVTVKVIEFSDYLHVNEALAAGDLDANAFQHTPYLNKLSAKRGYKFTALGKTVIFPLGVYSQKIRDKKDIPAKGLVTIPVDPSNCGRALQILHQNGIIKLRDGVGSNGSVIDIVGNPLKLRFREVESALLARSLPDVAFSVINGSWAVKSGLVPKRDAFILEGEDSDFANVLVVRTAEKDRPEFKILLKAYQSPEVKDYVLKTYKGSVMPAF